MSEFVVFVSLYFCFKLIYSIRRASCQHYGKELSNTIVVFFFFSFCDSGHWDFGVSRQTDSSGPNHSSFETQL